MHKLLLATVLSLCVLPSAVAATQAADVVNILYWGEEQGKEVYQRYKKPWSKLVLDTSTRKQIMAKEKFFEKELGDKFRLQSLRFSSDTKGQKKVVLVLFLGEYSAVAWKYASNEYCALHLDGNGSSVSGTKCEWL